MSELIAGSRSGGMCVLRIGRPGLGCSGRWMQLGWWKRRMLALRYLWVVFGGLRCRVVVGGRVVGLRLTRSSHCSVCRAGSRNGLYAQLDLIHATTRTREYIRPKHRRVYCRRWFCIVYSASSGTPRGKGDGSPLYNPCLLNMHY